jgi:signal transduction histidine kinase/ActR/RegA family two-component response regulator
VSRLGGLTTLPARAFRRELRTVYFAPFIAIAILAGFVLWRVSAQVSITKWVEHSDEVLLHTKDAQLDFGKMLLAFREYMTSADKPYLDELHETTIAFEKDLEEIAALVTDNPDQERRIIRVSEVYVPGRLEELVQEKESGTLRSDPIAQARAYTKQVLDAMDAFSVAEYELRAQRSARQTGLYQAVIVLVPVFSALIAIVLSYAGWRQIGRSSQQFAAALAKAEEANLAKDNFLATVSHELRNPLNAIVLLASILLSDQEVHEGARQRVKAIDRAARTQAQLIDDLLDVSRIKSGRLRLDVQATDLAKVVKAAVDSMRVTAEAKAIALHDIVDTSVAVIAGDPKRLEQVVWNLLSNAIKFTPKGGKVQVRLERINSQVEIIVADNGQGIAPSSVPYVFDRFWQETESGRSRSGVGLGLSIVKELVALHGGTVMAHSDGIGKGSTFTVRLPLPPATAPLLEPRRHPTVAPADNAATASRLDGFSILVVDDEPEACEALTKLLGSLGATVYAENSVEAALRMLDRTRPDAIVADIEMPVHDGFFFAREVRNREQDRRPDGRVPLIALTAYGRIDDKVKILASGFESHVVKPVDLAELSATIRSLVAARAA